MRRIPLSGIAIALAAGLLVAVVVLAVGPQPETAKASHGNFNVHVHDDYFHPTGSFVPGVNHANAIALCMAAQPDTTCTSVIHAVAGDSITWISPAPLAANVHTVTECTDNTFTVCGAAVDPLNPINDSGNRNPPNPGPSGWPYGPISFQTPGFYYYRCEIHPNVMRGVVQIIANNAPPAGVGGIAGLLDGDDSSAGAPRDAQAEGGDSVLLAVLLALGASVALVGAGAGVAAWKRVRREEE